MGGWVCLQGDVSDFDERLRRFCKTFSIEGVPALHLKTPVDENHLKIVTWAWHPSLVPDVWIASNAEKVLVLCGVITGLPGFADLSDQQLSAQRALDMIVEDENVLSQINGSFSLFLYDRVHKKTTLYTDRFASRSVWMIRDGQTQHSGNFPSALAALMAEQPTLSAVGLWSLFQAGRHLGKHGLYEGMRSLQAGQKALVDSDRVTIESWHQRRYEPEEGISLEAWGRLLSEALIKSANSYKAVSSDPHLFLSGGLDSRVAAASWKQALTTVTLCTTRNMESRCARMVAQILCLNHQEIERSKDWYLRAFDAASLISSGNHFNQHCHFVIPLQRLTVENPRASFLLGDLLENLNKHYTKVPLNGTGQFTPDGFADLLYKADSYILKPQSRHGQFFQPHLREMMQQQYNAALRAYAEQIMPVSDNDADRLDTAFRWIDVSVTPTFSMISCIWPFASERNIYFDNDVDDLALRIPANVRASGLIHIAILRHLSRWLHWLPDANDFLPPVFPKLLKKMAKNVRPVLGQLRRGLASSMGAGRPTMATSGSWLLLHEVYRKDPSYRDRIASLLLDRSAFPEEIFNHAAIENVWNNYLHGDISRHFEIESLISFANLHKLIPSKGIGILDGGAQKGRSSRKKAALNFN